MLYDVKHFIVIRVVTARLLITEKPSATFIPEWLGTWGSSIIQEDASKTLNSLQYLTIYYSVIAQESLLIKRDKPILNKRTKSFPLELFD